MLCQGRFSLDIRKNREYSCCGLKKKNKPTKTSPKQNNCPASRLLCFTSVKPQCSWPVQLTTLKKKSFLAKDFTPRDTNYKIQQKSWHLFHSESETTTSGASANAPSQTLNTFILPFLVFPATRTTGDNLCHGCASPLGVHISLCKYQEM